MLNKANTATMLAQETEKLTESIQQQLSRAPDPNNIVRTSDATADLLGHYHNSQHWPDMKIFSEHGQLKVSWGALKGNVLQQPKGYKVHFGALQRSLSISYGPDGAIHLRNGSLQYDKI